MIRASRTSEQGGNEEGKETNEVGTKKRRHAHAGGSTRRGFLAASVAGGAVVTGACLSCGKRPAPSAGACANPGKPNVVLIYVDDLGYGELGCQGNAEVPTPNIDSLAKNGVRFTQGYVTSPYCSPSRAGLMTGRYQTRFGHENNPTGRHNLHPKAGLPLSERTLADQLKAGGYATGLVGKWHLGATEPYHPLRRGFDEFYGFLHEGHFYVPPPYRVVVSFLRKRDIPPAARPYVGEGDLYHYWLNNWDEPPYDENNPLLRGTQPAAEDAYLTDAFTREAVSFIERHRDRPFFLYLPYNALHSPLQAPSH